MTQAFQRANKDAELVAALAEIDLKQLGQPYMVTNLISNMMRTPQGPARVCRSSSERGRRFPMTVRSSPATSRAMKSGSCPK